MHQYLSYNKSYFLDELSLIGLALESELLYEMSRAYHGGFDSQASAAALKVFNFGIVFKMDLVSHIISFTFFISLNIKFQEAIL
jgi:hypothetical protein